MSNNFLNGTIIVFNYNILYNCYNIKAKETT